jgi:hypothetical protein
VVAFFFTAFALSAATADDDDEKPLICFGGVSAKNCVCVCVCECARAIDSTRAAPSLSLCGRVHTALSFITSVAAEAPPPWGVQHQKKRRREFSVTAQSGWVPRGGGAGAGAGRCCGEGAQAKEKKEKSRHLVV